MISPRNLKSVALLIVILLIFKFGKMTFRLGVCLVLLTFNYNLLEHNQPYTLSNSLLIVNSFCVLSKLHNNVVSSAYIKMLKMLLTVGRSLMYIKTNRGPKTDP